MIFNNDDEEDDVVTDEIYSKENNVNKKKKPKQKFNLKYKKDSDIFASLTYILFYNNCIYTM